MQPFWWESRCIEMHSYSCAVLENTIAVCIVSTLQLFVSLVKQIIQTEISLNIHFILTCQKKVNHFSWHNNDKIKQIVTLNVIYFIFYIIVDFTFADTYKNIQIYLSTYLQVITKYTRSTTRSKKTFQSVHFNKLTLTDEFKYILHMLSGSWCQTNDWVIYDFIGISLSDKSISRNKHIRLFFEMDINFVVTHCPLHMQIDMKTFCKSYEMQWVKWFNRITILQNIYNVKTTLFNQYGYK